MRCARSKAPALVSMRAKWQKSLPVQETILRVQGAVGNQYLSQQRLSEKAQPPLPGLHVCYEDVLAVGQSELAAAIEIGKTTEFRVCRRHGGAPTGTRQPTVVEVRSDFCGGYANVVAPKVLDLTDAGSGCKRA